MRDKPGDLQRLLHIRDAINEAQNFVGNVSFDEFINNTMMCYACTKLIENVGEAAKHISLEVKSQFPAISWKRITGMRHILVHEYFGVDFEVLWNVMQTELPILKPQIQQIIDNLSPPSV